MMFRAFPGIYEGVLRMFHEYDVVALVVDLPEENLTAGATGTILMVYDDGVAYEVEFMDEHLDPATGKLVANVHTSVLVTLKPDQIQFVWSEGIGLRRG